MYDEETLCRLHDEAMKALWKLYEFCEKEKEGKGKEDFAYLEHIEHIGNMALNDHYRMVVRRVLGKEV
jgi:hypothetical protein